MTILEAFQIALQRQQAGRLAEAEALYRQILALQPDHFGVLHSLGLVAHQTGRHGLAVDLIRQSIVLCPNDPIAHFNLGSALLSQCHVDDATGAFRRALQIKSDFPEALNSLGMALASHSRIEEAKAAYRRALQVRPDYPDAHNNLGVILAGQGQSDEAIPAYREALRLRPNFAEAHMNLGNALKDLGEMEKAVAAYRRALQCKPDFPQARLNLGVAFRERGELAEAAVEFRGALALKRDYPEAHYNLGNLFREEGKFEEAVAEYREAIRLRPDYQKAYSNLIYTLHFDPGQDTRTISEEQQRWNRQFSEPFQRVFQPHANDSNANRCLRIGYVSPDFRDHPVGRFVLPLLERHDREQFEIICYSGVARPDGTTERVRALAGKWRETTGLADAQFAEMVLRDQVDILVDLAMHTAGNRLPVFARRPAPVQATWLAYPGGTGVLGIDYRLTDAHMDPPGERARLSSEEPVLLPDCWCCYQQSDEAPEINPLPAWSARGVTFGCLNNFAKVNERVLALWTGILNAVRSSRILLFCPEGRTRERVLGFFGSRGIVAERVELVGLLPRWEYLALYRQIDLGLDPFPCNGMTTTCDALWMGVPVLTLPGEMPASRAGLSLLSSIGLGVFAASSEKDYLRIAVELAGDLPRLAEIRATLRAQMLASPLMDAPRFARNVESAYRSMWERWCTAKVASLD